jgi:hypothetical protein
MAGEPKVPLVIGGSTGHWRGDRETTGRGWSEPCRYHRIVRKTCDWTFLPQATTGAGVPYHSACDSAARRSAMNPEQAD